MMEQPTCVSGLEGRSNDGGRSVMVLAVMTARLTTTIESILWFWLHGALRTLDNNARTSIPTGAAPVLGVSCPQLLRFPFVVPSTTSAHLMLRRTTPIEGSIEVREGAIIVLRIGDGLRRAVAVDRADTDEAPLAVAAPTNAALRWTIAVMAEAPRALVPDNKLQTSDGSGSVETFRSHFENCNAYSRWAKGDKLAHLKAALTGDARRCGTPMLRLRIH